MTNRREHAVRAALALICALAMSACGSARYPAYYTLHLEPSTQAPASTRGSAPGDQGIALSRVSLRGPPVSSSDAGRSRFTNITAGPAVHGR